MIGRNSEPKTLLADADTSKFPSLQNLVLNFIEKNPEKFSISKIRSLPVDCKEKFSAETVSLILKNSLDKAQNSSQNMLLKVSGTISPILPSIILLSQLLAIALATGLIFRFSSASIGSKISYSIICALITGACLGCFIEITKCFDKKYRQITPLSKVESNTIKLMREITSAQIVISNENNITISSKIKFLAKILFINPENGNFENLKWIPSFSGTLEIFSNTLPQLSKEALLGILPTALVVDAGAAQPLALEAREMSSRGAVQAPSLTGVVVESDQQPSVTLLTKFSSLITSINSSDEALQLLPTPSEPSLEAPHSLIAPRYSTFD
jgi:hypothetical protein